MPLATAAILGALVPALTSIGGGVASSIAGHGKNKNPALEAAKADPSGFTSMGEDLTQQDYNPSLTLNNSKKPILFGKYLNG